MFLGRFEHSVDDKSRLSMPARFRERLADGLVIMSSTERCLLIYPMDEFQKLFDKVSALPTVDPQAALLRRMLFVNASDATPDKQNRIVVPQALREYAGISDGAILVGVGRWLEVWSPDAWALQQAEITRQAQDADARLALAKLGV
jgi:MraZ protein